jgi:hypothetical protein
VFKKATKAKAKLRAAIFGPSGSGKTITALRLAHGIGGTIALIDSERFSASKYADHPEYRFSFDVCDLELDKQKINDYVKAISEAGKAGYNVLIIDSLSHAWQELLQEVELLAKSPRHKGNTWSAWSEGTPKQKQLVNAILDFPGHVIATIRSKTAWVESEGKNGKKVMERVGLAPEQGKGIEYEFDMLFEVTTDHVMTVLKDRSGKFQDQIFEKPGETLGAEMVAWLNEGSSAPRPLQPAVSPPGPVRPAAPAGAPPPEPVRRTVAAPAAAPAPVRRRVAPVERPTNTPPPVWQSSQPADPDHVL